MGILDLFKPKKTSDLLPDNSKVLFAENFLIVGENYECRKNPKKQRMEVIKKTKTGDSVHIEKYMYQGKPAYMIVNTKQNLDLGVLSSGAAEWLSKYYSKGDTIVNITDKYQTSFHVDVVVIKK